MSFTEYCYGYKKEDEMDGRVARMGDTRNVYRILVRGI
jgi:hypothetical protein